MLILRGELRLFALYDCPYSCCLLNVKSQWKRVLLYFNFVCQREGGLRIDIEYCEPQVEMRLLVLFDELF